MSSIPSMMSSGMDKYSSFQPSLDVTGRLGIPIDSSIPSSMQHSGVWDTNSISFVSEVNYRLKCCVCQAVLFKDRDPGMTECGHRICAECVSRLLQSGEPVKCPAGEEDCQMITSHQDIIPDKAVLREINQLQVYCIYRPEGCSEILLYRKLKAHLESGCPDQVELCPGGCGVKLPRIQMKDHLKTCQSKPEPCSYSPFGCNFSGNGQHLSEHMVEPKVRVTHSTLIGKIGEQHNATLQKMQIQIQQIEESLRDKKLQNKKKLDEVAKRSSSPKMPQQEVNAQIKELVHGMDKILEHLGKQNRKLDSMESSKKTFASTRDMTTFGVMRRDFQVSQKKIDELTEELVALQESVGDAFIVKVKKELASHDEQLKEADDLAQEDGIELRKLENTSYDGTLLWPVSSYQWLKEKTYINSISAIHSPPFYTSRYGYRLQLRAYLNGDSIVSKNFLSIYVILLKGQHDAMLRWPFQQKITLALMAQYPTSGHDIEDTFTPDCNLKSVQRPQNDGQPGFGCPLFAKIADVEQQPYLADDKIFIKVKVHNDDLKDASLESVYNRKH